VVGDPVGSGLVASLARPGGNITGLSNQTTDVATKRLELLREVVPNLKRLAIMANVNNPVALLEIAEVEAAAGTLGLAAVRSELRQADDVAPAFEALRGRAEALYVVADGLTINNRVAINTLALFTRIPTVHGNREVLEGGGLMSFGAYIQDLFRRGAEIVDKVLRGAKPGDIPVEQPTKFELVINMKTAKTLGLTVPSSVQLQADEVIE
jgi:putative ABC transport system substrate-binding protein